jgi:hypothetical protein
MPQAVNDSAPLARRNLGALPQVRRGHWHEVPTPAESAKRSKQNARDKMNSSRAFRVNLVFRLKYLYWL